jgi:Na+-driven multidrug efflux pump
MATAGATDGEAAALPLLLPREKEEAPPWRQWAREAGRLGYLALPMVGVTLSQYGVQVSSNMVVGHLPGVLPLSSAAIATSLATVSGFSLLVSLSLSLFFFASVRLLPSISHAVLPCAARVSIGACFRARKRPAISRAQFPR